MQLCGDLRGLTLLCKSEIDENTDGNDGLEAVSATFVAGQVILEETTGRDNFETINSIIKNRTACS